MRNVRSLRVRATAFALALLSLAGSRTATAQKVTVVDMIPNLMNNEIADQAEPNLAVDPANPSRMILRQQRRFL